MSQVYNITMKQFNGTDYDILNPSTNSSQITPSNSVLEQFNIINSINTTGNYTNLDDVLGYLGTLNMYWWKRRSIIYEPVVSEIKTISITSPNSTFPLYFIYADTIEVDKNNNIVFVSPSNFSFTFSSADFAQLENAAAGKYWISDSVLQNSFSQVFYTPEQTTVTRQTSTQFNFTNSCEVIGKSTYSDWEYVQSTSSSTYPQSGEQDGYEYVFLGAPFQNIINGAKIEVGSYVGTGTYGQSNPNTLTFGFVPKLFVVTSERFISLSVPLIIIPGSVMNLQYTSTDNSYVIYSTISNTTLSWYTNSSQNLQANVSGETYTYVAIG